jgi:hypothetical protein
LWDTKKGERALPNEWSSPDYSLRSHEDTQRSLASLGRNQKYLDKKRRPSIMLVCVTKAN